MDESRECFIKDRFISVQDCEEQQLKLNEGACDGCGYLDTSPGSVQEEGTESQTTEGKKKPANFYKPCVGCLRPNISKPAGGMCPKCYLESRKEKVSGKVKATPVKKKATDPPLSEPIKLSVAYVPPKDPVEPVASLYPNTPAVFLVGMLWVIALYWLCGYNFERGKDLGGWFFGATFVGCALVWICRHLRRSP